MWVKNSSKLSTSLSREKLLQSFWQEIKIIANGKAFEKYEHFNFTTYDKGAMENWEDLLSKEML